MSREHLFRVLTGARQSRSLLRRYLELKQAATAHEPRCIPDIIIPGGNNTNDGAGAGLGETAKGRPGQNSLRRRVPV